MANEKKSNRKFYQKKRFIIPILLVVGLIIFRIFLPTLVKNYVNKILANDIPGYYGQVEDIDIALYRGAYVIKGLYLDRVSADSKTPFINLPETDISIEWKSLFDGRIVSEIYAYDPQLTYILEDMDEKEKSDEEDWSEALTNIVPVDINHFEIINGKFAFIQLNATPTIDLHLNELDLVADNLRNVKARERKLPSPISATAVSIGQGKFSLDGAVDIIKKIPDMDIKMSLEKTNLTALNNLSEHYAKIDFENGNISLFSELAIADSHMKGYAKVLLDDVKFIGEEDDFLNTLWEGFVGFFEMILQNPKTDKFALEAPIEGDLSDIQVGVWPTIGSIFVNAFADAMQSEVDDKIEYKDAFQQEEEEEKKGFFKKLFSSNKK